MTPKDDGVIILHQQPGIHFIYYLFMEKYLSWTSVLLWNK